MNKFTTLKSIPAYLPMVNIDTDMIIPKQFLKTIKRTGLGKNLFYEMRYNNSGKEIEDFILEDRIEAVKKYKLNATPTIIINNKKFDKALNFKNLKKSIEKLI